MKKESIRHVIFFCVSKGAGFVTVLVACMEKMVGGKEKRFYHKQQNELASESNGAFGNSICTSETRHESVIQRQSLKPTKHRTKQRATFPVSVSAASSINYHSTVSALYYHILLLF